MDAKFHLKRDNFEVEVAGPVPFVENLLQNHLAAWLSSMGSEQLQHGTESPSGAAEATAFPRVDPRFQPKVNVTLEEFTQMKEAVSPSDLLIVAAYYLEKYRRQESFELGELHEALKLLPAWECRETQTEIEMPIASGFLERLRDGRYTLTFKGQNYVRNGLA